jgi:hypothetical protein
MKLLRMIVATFEPIPEGWEFWPYEHENIEITATIVNRPPAINEKLQLLLVASTEIDFPEIGDDGYVIAPKDKRQALETHLVAAANIVSVFGGCKRTLSATIPSVALIPGNDAERKKLDSSKGFLTNPLMKADAMTPLPITSQFIQGLGDRIDGVNLLAQAQSHGLQSGQFLEYVRLFESGFGIQLSQMEKKLLQFLNPDFGYTRSEIRSWTELRNPLVHADRKVSKKIVIDLDIRVTQRMKQAAYDVLLNKATWGDRSHSRRQLWIPDCWTTSAQSDLKVLQGHQGSIRFWAFDSFGVFPLNLEAAINPLPADWWHKSTDELFPDFKFEVIPINNQ